MTRDECLADLAAFLAAAAIAAAEDAALAAA